MDDIVKSHCIAASANCLVLGNENKSGLGIEGVLVWDTIECNA
jgi:hypothetical protein